MKDEVGSSAQKPIPKDNRKGLNLCGRRIHTVLATLRWKVLSDDTKEKTRKWKGNSSVTRILGLDTIEIHCIQCERIRESSAGPIGHLLPTIYPVNIKA
jgi:hypothetical protein